MATHENRPTGVLDPYSAPGGGQGAGDPDERTMVRFMIGLPGLAVFAGLVVGIAEYATR